MAHISLTFLCTGSTLTECKYNFHLIQPHSAVPHCTLPDSLEEGVSPLVSGVVGVTRQLVVQLAARPSEEVCGPLGEDLDSQWHDVPQHVGVVRVEAGVEVDSQHAHVVAVCKSHHLLPDISHHALGDNPQVVGGVEADLGAVGEDDLGLGLGAVQEDDPDLTLRYL